MNNILGFFIGATMLRCDGTGADVEAGRRLVIWFLRKERNFRENTKRGS